MLVRANVSPRPIGATSVTPGSAATSSPVSASTTRLAAAGVVAAIVLVPQAAQADPSFYAAPMFGIDPAPGGHLFVADAGRDLMSSDREAEPLRGSSRDERPNIGVLLRDPVQEVVRRVSAGLAAAGFDDIRPAHTVLFQHIEAGGSRLTDLAERAQITKQSMSYLVDHLERHGYLERRPDPRDRRATLICLTQRGWDEIRVALGIIAELEVEWARELGSERLEQLRDTLTELRNLIRR